MNQAQLSAVCRALSVVSAAHRTLGATQRNAKVYPMTDADHRSVSGRYLTFACCVVGVSLLLATSLPVVAAASNAIFLAVPGIPGEATFPPAAGQIDLLSISTGIGPTKTPKSSSAKYGAVGVCAARASKPLLSSYCVVKHVDKASPKLFLAAAQGTLFPTVTISLYRIDLAENTTPYAVYVLSNAIVSSVQIGAQSAAASDIVPTETVCFSFDKAQISVGPVDATGAVGTPVVVGFDACLGVPF